MMGKRAPRRGRIIPALIACFYAGGVAGWLLHGTFSRHGGASSPAVPATVAFDEPHQIPAATAG